MATFYSIDTQYVLRPMSEMVSIQRKAVEHPTVKKYLSNSKSTESESSKPCKLIDIEVTKRNMSSVVSHPFKPK